MKVIDSIRKKIKSRIKTIVKTEVENTLSDMLPLLPQLVEFSSSPPEKRQLFYDHTKDPLGNYAYYCDLRARLSQCGILVEDTFVDITDFLRWLKKYPEIDSTYSNLGDGHIEKCLEHYLSHSFLNMSSVDTFIDIAASGSPYADLLRKRTGVQSYSLDLAYPDGIHGHKIGANAADTGLPDEFASTLALHCAYECFMQDADIKFVKEASRILKPGGRYVIVPLYLDDKYFISTSPYCHQEKIIFDAGALKVWRDDSHMVPFSRHYSPEVFFDRIYSKIPDDMIGKVYFLKNLPDVMKNFSGQRIYCFFIFYCEKQNNSL